MEGKDASEAVTTGAGMMNGRVKHILAGSGLLLLFFLCLGVVAASACLPGYPGEFGRACLALLTSPLVMETSVFFLALTLLLAVNGWRRNREGSDWVAPDENGVPGREK